MSMRRCFSKYRRTWRWRLPHY